MHALGHTPSPCTRGGPACQQWPDVALAALCRAAAAAAALGMRGGEAEAARPEPRLKLAVAASPVLRQPATVTEVASSRAGKGIGLGEGHQNYSPCCRGVFSFRIPTMHLCYSLLAVIRRNYKSWVL